MTLNCKVVDQITPELAQEVAAMVHAALHVVCATSQFCVINVVDCTANIFLYSFNHCYYTLFLKVSSAKKEVWAPKIGRSRWP